MFSTAADSVTLALLQIPCSWTQAVSVAIGFISGSIVVGKQCLTWNDLRELDTGVPNGGADSKAATVLMLRIHKSISVPFLYATRSELTARPPSSHSLGLKQHLLPIRKSQAKYMLTFGVINRISSIRMSD